MQVRLRELRRYILQEISAAFAARLTNGLVFVAGPSYEGSKYVAALEAKDLALGKINVVGSATYQQYRKLKLSDGRMVQPYLIDSLFASSAAASVALVQVAFSLCGAVVPSSNISPAASRLIMSYYERNKGTDLVVPFEDRDDPERPWVNMVYFDPGLVNADELIKNSLPALRKAAKQMGTTTKDLRDSIFSAQENGFSQAFKSTASGRPSALLALSGGVPTIEKLNACTKTDNYEALKDYLEQLSVPLRPEFKEWLEDKASALEVWGGFEDVLPRLLPGGWPTDT